MQRRAGQSGKQQIILKIRSDFIKILTAPFLQSQRANVTPAFQTKLKANTDANPCLQTCQQKNLFCIAKSRVRILTQPSPILVLANWLLAIYVPGSL